MKFFIYPLLLVLLPLAFGGVSVKDNESIEGYLGTLATTYNKKLAPTRDSDSPVNVFVSAYILDIYKMDDSNMDFTADFYFRQKWNDSRLMFTDKEKEVLKDGITLKDVNSIWTPDLFFVEERQGLFHQVVHPNIFCRISPNGEVLFSTRLTITFSCPMELHYYPHDIQRCNIDIESYGFQRKDIKLYWYNAPHKPLSYSEGITMLDFDLIDATPSQKDIVMTFGTYSRLEMDLTFKRKSGYFVLRLFVPFILLALMTSLSFWIRAEQRCLRLSLLLVILYLMVSISTSMNSVIPKTSYTKASDVWIGFCQSLVFAAFMEFIVVGVIAGRKSEQDGLSNTGEIALTLDPEGKDLLKDCPKSPLTKVIHMFGARTGGQNELSLRIDKICRIVFPTVFVSFVIVYCSVYFSA